MNTAKNTQSYSKARLRPKKVIKGKVNAEKAWQEILCLTNRYYTQCHRRPSSLLSGILQPLLWLILFGALFQNAPVNLLTENSTYYQFLSPGIIVFSSFTGAMNSGLPIMFDREFGFLNRLLVAPLGSRDSLLISSIVFISTVTILQTIAIITSSFLITKSILNIFNIATILVISLLITLAVGSASICLAFVLPGHIEFLAIMLIANLPTLFSSTALAPLSFMPYWLQVIASINPLTYAIESTRFLYLSSQLDLQKNVLKTTWLSLNTQENIYLLTAIAVGCFIIVKNIISQKCD